MNETAKNAKYAKKFSNLNCTLGILGDLAVQFLSLKDTDNSPRRPDEHNREEF